MNPKTYKMLDISTAHITFEDTLILDKHCNNEEGDGELPFSCVKYPEGYFINSSNITAKDCKTLGLSVNFLSIALSCQKKKIPFINFDRDGEIYDDLKSFGW